jgi:cyclic pyranopterin phosphate synthase
MLVDGFGRRITNLRISVTRRCNLGCFYCHREGYESSDEMSVEEIARICKAFHSLGVRKLKITGGEPLVREDIVEIIAAMPPFDEISMTTNGVLLADYAQSLKDAGLSRVNVSLDTLNTEKYRFATRGGRLERVLEGIEAAVEAGLTPVKLNMVLMKNFNHEELQDLLSYASSFNRSGNNVILQVIELLNLPGLEDYYFDISEVEEEFAEMAREVRVRAMQRRKQYVLDNAVIEFVKPLDNSEFCGACNRIRVTADGKIKPCLMRNDNLVDIRRLEGEELIRAIQKAVGLREPYFGGDRSGGKAEN